MKNRALVYVDFFKKFHATASGRCANYGSTDGTPHGQAASLESLICFINFVQAQIPTGFIQVLDAGAGATTAVLCNENRFVVTSTDPDLEYLKEVKATIKVMGLPEPTWHGSVTHGEGRGQPLLRSFHACFYDYGTHERFPLMDHFAAKTTRFFYVDDCHGDNEPGKGILWKVDKLIGSGQWKLAKPYDDTRDEFGRFGALLERTQVV